MESKHITMRLPVVLLDAMQAEAAQRSTMVRRVSLAELIRESLMGSFMPDGDDKSRQTVNI